MLAISARRRAGDRPASKVSTRVARRTAATVLASLLTMACLTPAHATMYKCRGSDGRTTYGDEPCANGGGEWKPRTNITVLPSSSLTGSKNANAGESATTDARPQWLKPIDPIGDCKRRGGKIDKELRACMLP
ncbi:MAG: DUF4124 domain-containing protein [Burkholderiaceae bacterium]